MNGKKVARVSFFMAGFFLAVISMSDLTISASNGTIESTLFSRVEYAVEQGRLKEAKEDIQRVLKLNPRHPGAKFYAGLYSYEESNYDTSERFLNRVINDKTYGARARQILADIRLNRYQKRLSTTIETHIQGGAYQHALSLIEEAMAEMPANPDLVFKAAYISIIAGFNSKAQAYTRRFGAISQDQKKNADLQLLYEGWFEPGFEQELALQKLMSITDDNLLTTPVRDRIKSIIADLGNVEQFETFINREKNRPGANIQQLDAELINFLINQNKFKQALSVLNKQQSDSFDMNLLRIRLMAKTEQETKAMLNARHLMATGLQDLRIYEIWVEAWLEYYKRNNTPPAGADETGKPFAETAEEVLLALKPGRVATLEPRLLINLLRLAAVTKSEARFEEIAPTIPSISFVDFTADELLQIADDLIVLRRDAIAAQILESAMNQIAESHRLQVKLAEVYYASQNPQGAAAVLEAVLAERPQMLRAYLLLMDCLNQLGQRDTAINMLLERLNEPDLNDLIRRQLNAKLEVLRIQDAMPESSNNSQEVLEQDYETTEY